MLIVNNQFYFIGYNTCCVNLYALQKYFWLKMHMYQTARDGLGGPEAWEVAPGLAQRLAFLWIFCVSVEVAVEA